MMKFNDDYDFYHVRQAICNFTGVANSHSVNPYNSVYYIVNNGYALLTQYPDKTIVQLDLYDLPPGKHGFHIHEYADMREGCKSLGSHYNPHDNTHGNINISKNHLGDLGNITVDETGRCNQEIIVNNLPLSGHHSVIGRSMIIHEKEDDLGLGGDSESKKTGNSGERISCGIIGYL